MSETGPRFIDPSRKHRAAHRDRMHAEAHSQQEEHHAPILDHVLVSRGKPELIEEESALKELLEHLRHAGTFAFDSEFIGELTYVPKLCLIQVATTERIGLIDPLANIDLMPFWELVVDPAVKKIVHAGDQDIEPVVRFTGKSPANLVDTQVLAAFGAMAYPASLQKLVQTTLHFKLGKGLTFTHWDQRPLSEMQLRYAADDVRYLPALAEELSRRAEEAGNLEIARQECALRSDASRFRDDSSEQYTRIRGASNLSRTQLSVLRELCIWRDATARTEDVPTRALLRDDVLIGLVRTPIKDAGDAEKVRGMPRPVAKRFGAEIAAAVARGHAVPPEQRPFIATHEESPRERFEIDSLWARFQCSCFERKIDPVVAASRGDIAEFYRKTKKGENVNDHPLGTGWRGQIMPPLGLAQTPLDVKG
ncbi:MAG TPA: HRDC domain-containing protein [Tepidisphaeraceae bacterium]|jgi:ribonuclease D